MPATLHQMAMRIGGDGCRMGATSISLAAPARCRTTSRETFHRRRRSKAQVCTGFSCRAASDSVRGSARPSLLFRCR
jgi:hypothetical protein